MALPADKNPTRDALAEIIIQALRREGLRLTGTRFPVADRNVGLGEEQILAREILERFDAMMLMSSCAFGSGEEDDG